MAEEMEKPVTFKKGEVCWFVPATGGRQKVTIEDTPTETRSKHLVKFEDGSVTPVNACYLAKK